MVSRNVVFPIFGAVLLSSTLARTAKADFVSLSTEETPEEFLHEKVPTRFLRNASDAKIITRNLKKSGLNNMNNDIDNLDSLFDRPVKDWTAAQWTAVAIVVFVALLVLCCFFSLVRCILGCLCTCLTCRGGVPRRRYYNRGVYYDASAPLEDPRPPPFNPAYSNTRTAPANYDDPRMRSNSDCSPLDCVFAFCCLGCCTQNRFSLRDILCWLCCFEFCCRGGRDVIGNGNASNYGTFAR